MTPFIAVHIGAGYHSDKYEDLYKKLCKEACLKGMGLLKGGSTSCEAAVEATAILEDSPFTNAGYGSNLSLDGNVECDASVMTEGGFGSVGGVPSVKNPVRLAYSVLKSRGERLSLGRINPCLLVGDGAKKFAVEKGLEIVEPWKMISDKAMKGYTKYKNKLYEPPSGEALVAWKRLDTVGAVALDGRGTVSATCSSGGVMLKHPGRVGQAAIYGCGCWADSSPNLNRVAVSTSGSGEDIIMTTLAKTLADSLHTTDFPVKSLSESFDCHFMKSRYLSKDSTKLCGFIAIVNDTDEGGGGEFVFSHTTQSMGISYMSAKATTPKVKISRMDPNSLPGTKFIIEAIKL